MQTVQLNIITQEDEDGFYTYCPKFKGCQSQRDSLQKVKDNIYEAVKLYRIWKNKNFFRKK